MAQRTSSSAVQGILGGNYDDTTDLSPFIATATALTDKVSSNDSDSLLNDTLLELIERYLSAHFYQFHDKLKTGERIGKSSAQYQGQYGMMLKSSDYGQAALTLDLTGYLTTLGKKKVTLHWLGLPPSEQTDYEDRD